MKYTLFYNAYCDYIDEHAEWIVEFDHKPSLKEVISYLRDACEEYDESWLNIVAADIINFGGSSDFHLEGEL